MATADPHAADGLAALTARTRIKICGLTREADVDAAVDAGADAIGLVLYPHSARALTLQRAQVLADRLPPFVTPVLLFVNAAFDDVRRAADRMPQALLQFHGDEAPADCDAAARPYLRAARMAAGFDLLDFASCYPRALALLVDSHVEGYGGAGEVFDWSNIPSGVPHRLVLSGGLNHANVIDGIKRVRPWAVDVSSGVECAKGIKDAALIRRFCQAVRQADAALTDA